MNRRRSKATPTYWILVGLAFAAMIGQFVYLGMVSFNSLFPGPFREVVENPGSDFTQRTGLPWPLTAEVLSVGDTHGGWLGDGEFHLVFKADRAVLEYWLAKQPPWGQPTWQTGPVPHEIGMHCSFGTKHFPAPKFGDGPTEYLGDTEIEQVLGSNQMRFVAQDRLPDNPWYNGQVLIIDPANNQVWLCVWDM